MHSLQAGYPWNVADGAALKHWGLWAKALWRTRYIAVNNIEKGTKQSDP